MTGLKTYYMMVGPDPRIVSDIAVATEGTGPNAIVRYKDGGWNLGKDCYFTEEQCRRGNNLPPEKWETAQKKILERLDTLFNFVEDIEL